MNKKAILIGGAVLVVAAGIFAYSQYGVELGKFFAAEPGVTNGRLPQFSVTTTSGANTNNRFQQPGVIRLAAHWFSKLAVESCWTYRGSSGCDAKAGTTDASGNWHMDIPIAGISLGQWIRWVKIGGLESNHVTYTVVSGPTPGPSITPTPYANYLTGTLITNFFQSGLTTNYAVNVSGIITPLFIAGNASITDSSNNHLTIQDLKAGMMVQAAGAQNPNYTVRVWDISGIIVLSYSSPTPTSVIGTPVPTPTVVPVVSPVSLPSATLVTGVNTLAKFTVTKQGPGSQLGWKRMVFSVTKTAGPTLSNFQIFENGSDITSLGVMAVVGGGAGVSAATVTFTLAPIRSTSGTLTYELRATESATLQVGDWVQTSMANPSGSGAQYFAGTYAQQAAGSGAFIWTSNPSLGETAPNWFTDRNISFLPFFQKLTQ